MGGLQAQVEPRRLWRCKTPTRTRSKHLASRHRALQQVSTQQTSRSSVLFLQGVNIVC